jgi:hypothetical protein
MKTADVVELKKEVDMTEIDYRLNEPTDKSERPIKYHPSFREDPNYEKFVMNQKKLSRKLGIKEIGI